MPALTSFTWNPAGLNRALLAAYRPSVYQARNLAVQTSPSSKAGATVKRLNSASLSTARADLVPTGLGFVFESGREGGYPIAPGGVKGFRKSSKGTTVFNATGRTYSYRSKRGGGAKALRFSKGDGGYAAYSIGGPMKAEPYVKPAGTVWARTLFPAQARRTLASSGFGPGNVR